ncbi:MAG: hypothetical protein M1831_005742 [Alyxoria varia]|nr:MAG: hypothetical protein M1831_005742 [Alyxoria varia]
MNHANHLYDTQPSFTPSFDQSNQQSYLNPPANVNNINPTNLDLSSHGPNSHPQSRLSDGHSASQSPGIQHAPYQVPPVVPSKRPRPAEDGVTASPSLQHTSQSQSRSQTPQQPNFPQYGHLQNSSAHATPSPVPPSQPYHRPDSQQSHSQAGPMRSPSQFSGQRQSIGGFPPTQNGAHPFPVNQPFGRGIPPGQGMYSNSKTSTPMPAPATPTAGFSNPAASMPPNMNPNMHTDMQRQQYQMRLQHAQQAAAQQMQNNIPGVPGRPQPEMMDPNHPAAMASRMNGPARPPMMPPASQGMKMRSPAQGPQMQMQSFMDSLNKFTHQRGRQLNNDPKVCGRPIHYYQLFVVVSRIMPGQDPEKWNMVANMMNFPPQSYPTAASEIRTVYEQNMAEYLTTYMEQMRRRNMGQGQVPPGQFPGPQGSPTSGQPLERTPQPSVAPATPSFPANSQHQHQHQASSVSFHASPLMNNTSTPDARLSPNASRQNDVIVPPPPTSLNNRPSTSSIPHGSPHQSVHKLSPQIPAPQPDKILFPSSELETHYDTKHDKFLTYAGFTLTGSDDKPASMPEKANQLAHLKDRLLGYEYLGPVDLHALGMSLQSGIPSEISNALGQILSLSWHPFALAEYEDFVDILLEFGDAQISRLAPGTDSTTDTNKFSSFETLSKLVKLEPGSLEELPTYTQEGRALDRAAARLVDVTMILSNLSHTDQNRTSPIYEGNRKLISVPAVIELVSGIVEVFSCQKNAFRNPKHATDIMKNLITYLSNISDLIKFSSEAEALSLMRFLTAFAPAYSSLDTDGTTGIRFGVYQPQSHPYVPCAVDSLAKLLVKDEPNRAFYRAIFQAESTTTPISYRLLTGAFALAIAPIPEETVNIPSALRISDARKPFFIQGMLAADILASMSSASGSVVRQWLCSEDDWAVHLHHLIVQMALSDAHHFGNAERHPKTGQPIDVSMRGFTIITQRGLSMLKKLMEKTESDTRGRDDDEIRRMRSRLTDTVPSEDAVVRILTNSGFDTEALRQVVSLSKLRR